MKPIWKNPAPPFLGAPWAESLEYIYIDHLSFIDSFKIDLFDYGRWHFFLSTGISNSSSTFGMLICTAKSFAVGNGKACLICTFIPYVSASFSAVPEQDF